MEPGLLIASPQMHDTNFNRTVILLAHHGPQGALGVVINRAHEVRLGDILPDLPPEIARRAALWGGPVEPGAGFVVFQGGGPEGWFVPCGGAQAQAQAAEQALAGVTVSASRERLEELIEARGEFLLCLGYAGWGPGQLDEEFARGSWVYTEASLEVVFSAALEDRYDRALAGIGVTSRDLWMSPVDE